MSTLLSDGLIFSISPPCRKPQQRHLNDDENNENYMLILAPFNKIPKINFGKIKLNKEVTKSLLIINPQEFNLNLVITSESLNLNKIELNIDKKTTINFKLTWKPVKTDKYTFKINIEIKNSRLKFQINAFGECFDVKKQQKFKQPRTILQPIRHRNDENKVPVDQNRRETLSLTQNQTLLSDICGDITNDNLMNLTRTYSMQSIHNATPRFSDFYEKNNFETKINSRILNSTVIKTTRIEKKCEMFNQTVTYTRINVGNEYKVKQNLYQHSSDEDDDELDRDIEKEIEMKKLKAVVNIQKWIKSMKDRFRFLKQRRLAIKLQKKWKVKHEKRVNAAICIQRWTRSMKERYSYLHQRRLVVKIQRVWRAKYEKRVQAAVCVQRWTREMKQRYLYLQQRRLIIKIQQIWKIKYQRHVQAAVTLQKWSRSMHDRYLFLHKRRLVCKIEYLWRLKYEQKVQAAICIQKWSRSMKQRYLYLQQYRAICKVQQLWKQKYQQRLQAAICIQNWTRSMKQRYSYLQQRRLIIKVQQQWRLKYHKRVQAAICLQKWTRSMKQRFIYLNQHRQICKIQQIWKVIYQKRVQAALCIQKSWRAYKEKVNLKQKSAKIIQQKWRAYKIKQLKCELWQMALKNHMKLIQLTKIIHLKQEILRVSMKINQEKLEYHAACTIKRYWFAYKFHRNLKIYRTAAIKIQIWSRSMHTRYQYLHLKRVTIRIQHLSRIEYNRRHLAALKIQHAYRVYKLHQIEARQSQLLNQCATQIQSFWRGYKSRKLYSKALTPATNQSTTKSTIGDRFKHLLHILHQTSSQYGSKLSISQLISILVELYNLTSVSYECCNLFLTAATSTTKFDTIDILFRFIHNCNRSQPHIDLLNICLKLLINLLKSKQNLHLIVNKLVSKTCFIEQLLSLLKAFYLNNCQLFINSNLILIVLAMNSNICKNYLNNCESLKVLMKLKQLIVKRSNMKFVNLSDNYYKNSIKCVSGFNDSTCNNSILKVNFKKPIESLNYLLVNVLKA